MSILDPVDIQLPKGDRVIELLQEKEELIFELLGTASANRVVTNRNLSQLISEAISNPISELLSRYKGREVVSLDCRNLCKGDTYGFMATIAKKVEQGQYPIVIIENLAEIPEGSQCDNPQYVENLLGHSWKNDKVFFGEYCIDRSKLTIILTATPEQKEFLGQRFRADGYSWCEDFDVELDKIEEQLSEL
jgi:hypothetical protein